MIHRDIQNPVVRLSDLGNKKAVLVIPNRKRPFVDELDHVLVGKKHESASAFSLRGIISLLLIPFLTLQPFVRVYAQEVPESVLASEESVVVDDAEPVSDTPSEVPLESPTEPDPLVDGEQVGVEMGEDSQMAQENGTTTALEAEPSDEPTSSEEVASSTVELPDGEADPLPGIEDPEATSTDATTTPEEIVNDVSDPTSSTSTVETTQEPIQEFVEQTEVTFPESQDEQSAEEISIDQIIREKEEVMRRELRQQVEAEFTRGCVQLDSAGYYCLKQETPKWSGSLLPSSSISGVASEILPGGADKEIMIDKGGARMQLTSNDVDDVFPAKDISGTSVVWQGMVEGRWQVFVATFASSSPKITQLTSGVGGSFNPRVDGATVVWQAWVDNNWEIFSAAPHAGTERAATDPLPEQNMIVGVNKDWDVTRITLHEAHDMFPSVAGDVITWQRSQDGGWVVYAYSMKSGVATAVSSPDGKSENPRFTLVYEERGEGGVRLMGYDVATGENIDLSARAKNLPDQSSPYVPQAPITSEDQAALPSTGTSSPRTEFEEGDSPTPV